MVFYVVPLARPPSHCNLNSHEFLQHGTTMTTRDDDEEEQGRNDNSETTKAGV
jgi:hypothetical protein